METPEIIRSKKKKFATHFSCRILDDKMFGSGSGIRYGKIIGS
jgi:hypothetical protein